MNGAESMLQTLLNAGVEVCLPILERQGAWSPP